MRYLRHAGETALRRSAHAEAIALLTRATDLLQTLADGPARTRQEIMLRLALGPAWMAARGYAAPEVEQTYTRALELSRGLGELRAAREHLERSIPHGAASGGSATPDPRVLAYLAWTLWCQGHPDQALARGQEAAALARANGRPHHLAFVLGFVAWLHELRRESTVSTRSRPSSAPCVAVTVIRTG